MRHLIARTPHSRWYEHRVPPPVIDVGVAVLMWWLARCMPWAQVWPAGGAGQGMAWLVWAGAAALVLAGAALALAGVWACASLRTTVNPLAPQQASALVTLGVFAHTRNPMYLGMGLALAGWAVWLGNAAAALLGLALLVWALTVLQIRAEERLLRQRFGAAYAAYCARVRRWI